jgi:urocanate hydratase
MFFPEIYRARRAPDMVTDQTSRARSRQRLSAARLDAGQWEASASSDPQRSKRRQASMATMSGHARFPQARACRPSTTATTSARWPRTKGVENAFDFPGFVPAYIRPLFCRGIGPFRWVALSGDPEDIYRTDAKVKELIPDDRTCTTGSTWRASASTSRACRRASAGSASAIATGSASPSTRWWREGRAEGAGRHRPRPPRFRLGRLAQPRDRGDADGSDAVSDWPLLNALLNTASGATWVSLHHGGGVGMGFSQHSRHGHRAATARRMPQARIERVLWNDPGTGVMRHADAGYEIACRGERGVVLPRGWTARR